MTVTNVRNATGRVAFALCPRDKFLTENCPYYTTAPAHAGQTVVTMPDVPAGEWAVQAFHDENNNDVADQGLLGIPTEGVGFSNNAPFRFSAPRWADAVFILGPAGGRITLRLRYFN